MARQVTAQIRLQVPGGTATPAPPVGPALGQHGVNIGQFVSQFNDRTKEMRGITVPVVITVYSDRSFEFIVKSPPAAVLLKQAAGPLKHRAERPWRRSNPPTPPRRPTSPTPAPRPRPTSPPPRSRAARARRRKARAKKRRPGRTPRPPGRPAPRCRRRRRPRPPR